MVKKWGGLMVKIGVSPPDTIPPFPQEMGRFAG